MSLLETHFSDFSHPIYSPPESGKRGELSWGSRVFSAISGKGAFLVNSAPCSTCESVSLFWGPWAAPERFCGSPCMGFTLLFAGIWEKIVIKQEQSAAAVLKSLLVLESFAEQRLRLHPRAELLWGWCSPGLDPCPWGDVRGTVSHGSLVFLCS